MSEWKDIAAVKRKLYALGYGPADWEYAATDRANIEYTTAVVRFQRDNPPLVADGLVGPLTYAVIEAALAASTLIPLRVELVKRANELAALKIRETAGPNKGEPFDTYNRSAGVPLGSPYCVSLWHHEVRQLLSAHGMRTAFPIGASSSQLVRRANEHSAIVTLAKARPGDLIVYRKVTGAYYHTGLIIAVLGAGYFSTVEGNTSAQVAIIGEGDGVFARKRKVTAARCRVVDVLTSAIPT